jgi:hypothetical protein
MATKDRLSARIKRFHAHLHERRPARTEKKQAAIDREQERESAALLAAAQFITERFGTPLESSDFADTPDRDMEEAYWLLELDDEKVWIRLSRLLRFLSIGWHDTVSDEVKIELYSSLGFWVSCGFPFTVFYETGDGGMTYDSGRVSKEPPPA